MILLHTIDALDAACAGGTALSLGMFDGVHLGHQRLLAETVRRAHGAGLQALAITFEQHPLSLLAPPYAPGLLSGAEEKAALIAAQGIDLCLMIPFSPAFAAIGAAEFLEEIVVRRCRARYIICGDDFRFGQGGKGSVELLLQRGPDLGFEPVICPAVLYQERQVRSTRVRQSLLEGRVEEAATLLGRPYRLHGRVMEGDRRGRTIGFPTANLQPPAERLVPQNGVYAVRALLASGSHTAMLNIGTRPTFALETRTIEAHLLDFDGDIYGQELTLEFIARLRPEQRFSNVQDLIAQLNKDRDAARALVG